MMTSFVRNYRKWMEYRDTVDELNRMSNRDLADIGISRADIHEVAKNSVEK